MQKTIINSPMIAMSWGLSVLFIISLEKEVTTNISNKKKF